MHRRNPNLAANLNFLFKENNSTYIERFRMAKEAGFKAVEIPYPTECTVQDVLNVQEETGLQIVLINMKLSTKNEKMKYGIASVPNEEKTFRKLFLETLKFANSVNCKKIHIMAGLLTLFKTEKHHETFMRNLKFCSLHLEKSHVYGLIEPICNYAVPNYYLNDLDLAVRTIYQTNSPNIKLLFDVFHLQQICGDLTHTFNEKSFIIGHVQIGQVPDRNEPNTPGEVKFSYIFQMLKQAGYRDWIGCEYHPKNGTVAGLTWVTEFGYSL